MTLTIKDGRDKFYTFDTNRILLLTDDADSITSSVHLETDGDTSWDQPVMTDEDTQSKYVEIPQEFLEGDYSRLVAYFYCKDEDGNYTYTKQIFRITYRQEPEGYYISYTNRATWDSIKAYVDKWASIAKSDKEEADASAKKAKESEENARISEKNASASARQASDDKSAVSTMKTEVTTMKTSIEESATQVSSDKSAVSTMKTDISAMKSDVTVMKESVDSSKAQTQQMKDTTAQYKSDVQSLVNTAQSLVSKTVTETIIVNGSKVYKKSITIKNGRPYCTLTEVTE